MVKNTSGKKTTISYEEVCDLAKLKGWPSITMGNCCMVPNGVYDIDETEYGIDENEVVIDADYTDFHNGI